MDKVRRASCQYGSLECTKWKTDVDLTGIATPVCIKTCQSVLVKGIVDYNTLAFSSPLGFVQIECHRGNFCCCKELVQVEQIYAKI